MTIRRVFEEAISGAVGYVAGLGVLLVWPDRSTAPFVAVFVAGVVVFIAVAIAVDWIAYGHPPNLEWGVRPGRYSWPLLIALIIANVGLVWVRDGQDSSLTAYAVWVPVVLGGALLSNLLWAKASRVPSAQGS